MKANKIYGGLILLVLLIFGAVGGALAGKNYCHYEHIRNNILFANHINGKNDTLHNFSNLPLLNDGTISYMREHQENYKDIIDSMKRKLDYKASPLESLNMPPHYTSKGVNHAKNNGHEFAKDSQMAYNMALAYIITEDTHYARVSQRIMDAWANHLRTISTLQGRDVLNFNMPYMFIAASWVRNANKWDHHSFDCFSRRMLSYSNSSMANNHGFWGILFSASGAYYLGDTVLFNQMINRWHEHIRESINDQGVFPMEVERSNTNNWRGGPHKGIKGLAYTHFSLLPIAVTMVIFADAHRPQWNTVEGGLVRKAYNQAAEWTMTPSLFPYYKSNHGHLIGVDNDAYMIILGQHYYSKVGNALLKKGNLKMDGFHLKKIYPTYISHLKEMP